MTQWIVTQRNTLYIQNVKLGLVLYENNRIQYKCHFCANKVIKQT